MRAMTIARVGLYVLVYLAFSVYIMPPKTQVLAVQYLYNTYQLGQAEMPAELHELRSRLAAIEQVVAPFKTPEFAEKLKSEIDRQNQVLADVADVSSQIAPLNEGLKRLNTTLAELTNALGKAEKNEKGTIAKQVEDAEQKIADAKSRIAALGAFKVRLEKVETDISATRGTLTPLENSETGILVVTKHVAQRVAALLDDVKRIDRGVPGRNGSLGQQVRRVEQEYRDAQRLTKELVALSVRIGAIQNGFATPSKRSPTVAEGR